MSYRLSPGRPGARRAVRLLVLIAALLLAWMYLEATSDPIVRTASVSVRGLSTPLKLVLASDIHVAGPDMPPSRVDRLVSQINALHPDLVLLAGDFVSDKKLSTHSYSVEQAIAPLAGLRPKVATIAVLGNHDHWRNAEETLRQLRRAGIFVLQNSAMRAGPLTIGGVDDAFTGHDDVADTVALMRSQPEPRILISHSPDVFPKVPADVVLTVAGHTHCGQIRLPLVGALSTMSAYGDRYACGRIDEDHRTLLVSAGVGTSLLPLRLGARPDIWLIELKPAR